MSGGRREFVTQALLAHRDEIAHPHPELAARWCYTLCMAVLRERMTFGEASELAGGFADETVITELSRTVTGYLMSGTANDDAAGSVAAGPQNA